MKSIARMLVATFLWVLSQSASAGGIFPTTFRPVNVRSSSPGAMKVLYWGGPVLSHVKVYVIFWGDKVDAQVKAGIGDFYGAAANSTYVDWLQEYNTRVPTTSGAPGTNQDIGRGYMMGEMTISPQNQATKLDKVQVQAELEYQMSKGLIPLPDRDSLYMIYFPPGVDLTTGGRTSCKEWCGDHEAFHSARYGNIYYGMMPDISGSTCGGCGFAATIFDSITFISSHELIEAITDPFCPDMDVSPAAPAAWMASDLNEVGDLCIRSQGTLVTPTKTFFIEGGWDNPGNACKGGRFTSP